MANAGGLAGAGLPEKYKTLDPGRDRRLNGEVAELLAYPLVEAGAGELGEAADAVGEADLRASPGASVAGLRAVDGDVDRVAALGVADVEDVAGGDDQGPRGERVRGDVADA